MQRKGCLGALPLLICHPPCPPLRAPPPHLQAEQLAELARVRVAEEQQLAAALERRLHESDRHTREVQLLLQRSAEIRRLKEALQVAEVRWVDKRGEGCSRGRHPASCAAVGGVQE